VKKRLHVEKQTLQSDQPTEETEICIMKIVKERIHKWRGRFKRETLAIESS